MTLTVIVLAAAGAAFAYAQGSPTEAAVAPGEPKRRSPRPPARPCVAADLGKWAWTGMPSPQDPPHSVVVLMGPHRDSRCTLAGSARIRGTDRAGRRVTLTSRPAPRPSGGPEQYPATLDPGEPGRLVFTPVAGCRPEVTIDRIGIEVDGFEIPMVGTERIPECAITIGEWHVIPPFLHGRPG